MPCRKSSQRLGHVFVYGGDGCGNCISWVQLCRCLVFFGGWCSYREHMCLIRRDDPSACMHKHIKDFMRGREFTQTRYHASVSTHRWWRAAHNLTLNSFMGCLPPKYTHTRTHGRTTFPETSAQLGVGAHLSSMPAQSSTVAKSFSSAVPYLFFRACMCSFFFFSYTIKP